MLLIPTIHQAYWEAEQEAEEKARTKLQERVIKRWTRLVHGLRIRQRLQEQYGDKPQTEERHWLDTQAHGTDPDGEEGVSASHDSCAVHIEDLFLRRTALRLEVISPLPTMWCRHSIYLNINTSWLHIPPTLQHITLILTRTEVLRK
jgi:hypothetical protein